MSNDAHESTTGDRTRRRFFNRSLTSATGAALTSGLAAERAAHAAGDDTIKIALIGCGGRGAGAAIQALSNKATRNVKLVAMADAFRDRVDNSLQGIQSRCKYPERVDVPEARRFTDFDGYQQAIQSDADLVLLCTPPGFRPMQFEAAVKAGKHVFMEKPVAVDAPGIRKVLAANEEAKRKGLAVCVGLSNLALAAFDAVLALYVIDPGPMGQSEATFGLLLAAFAGFVVLCGAAVFGVQWFIFQSRVPLDVTVTVSRGAGTYSASPSSSVPGSTSSARPRGASPASGAGSKRDSGRGRKPPSGSRPRCSKLRR